MKKIAIICLLFISIKSFSQTEYYTTTGKDRLTKKELKSRMHRSKLFGKKAYTGFVIRNTTKKQDSVIHKVTFKKNPEVLTKILLSSWSKLKNKELPSFSLKTLDGEIIDLEKLKGKPTMINFWFTKCVPCIKEMPLLNDIKKKYENHVNFVAITYEDRDSVNTFLKKYDFDFMHLINGKEYIKALGIKAFPTNLFLDKNGILKYVKGGIPPKTEGEEYFTEEAIDEIIEIIEKLK